MPRTVTIAREPYPESRDRRQRALPPGASGSPSTARPTTTTGCAPSGDRPGRLRLGRALRAHRGRSSADVAEGVRPAPARRRGRRQGAPAARSWSATTTACSWCSRRSGTSTRTTPSRPARSTSSWATTSWSRSGTARARSCSRPAPTWSRREGVLTHGPSAVVYAVCDTVVDGYVGGRPASSRSTSTRSRRRSSRRPAPTTPMRIYTLKREIAEVRRAVMPLREPMRRFADGPGAGHRRRGRARSSATSLDHLNQAAEVVRQPRHAALDGVRRAPGADLGAAEQRHAQDLRRRRRWSPCRP